MRSRMLKSFLVAMGVFLLLVPTAAMAHSVNINSFGLYDNDVDPILPGVQVNAGDLMSFDASVTIAHSGHPSPVASGVRVFEGQGIGGAILWEDLFYVPGTSNQTFNYNDIDLTSLSTATPGTFWLTLYTWSGYDDLDMQSYEVNVVPEPATMMLLGAGLIGLAGFGRKKLVKK